MHSRGGGRCLCVKVTVEGLDRQVTSWERLFVRSKMSKQSIIGAARRLTKLGAHVENRIRCREAG